MKSSQSKQAKTEVFYPKYSQEMFNVLATARDKPQLNINIHIKDGKLVPWWETSEGFPLDKVMISLVQIAEDFKKNLLDKMDETDSSDDQMAKLRAMAIEANEILNDKTHEDSDKTPLILFDDTKAGKPD